MKRIISMLLVCILLLQAVPLTGFAYDEDQRYFKTFAELKELSAKTYTTKTRFNYTGTADLVISENLTLPQNTVFDLSDANVIIPKGVTFRSSVSAFAKNWVIKGTAHLYHTKVYDTMTVTGKVHFTGGLELQDDAARADRNIKDVIVGMDKITFAGSGISIRPYIYTLDELQAHIKRANTMTDPLYRFVLFLEDELVINQSLTIPENCYVVTWRYPVTVSKGCTLTVNGRFDTDASLIVEGKLVNNGEIDFTSTARLNIASGGKYSGRGRIFLYEDGNPADVINGLNLKDFTIKPWPHGGTELYYAAGLTQLPKPSSLKWGKLEDTSVWSNSAGGYTLKDVTAPGGISFKHNSTASNSFHVAVYNSKGTSVMEFYCGRNSSSDWVSSPYFILSNPASGTYYFEVTALGDQKKYRDSETVKSPTFKYTKPSKTAGKCTNVSWDVDTYPSFSAPSSTTYVGGYEIEIYYATSKTGTKTLCGRRYFFGTKSVPDVKLLDYSYVDALGPAYFFYKVRVISSDITARANGAWSEMSNGIYLEPLAVKGSNVTSSGKPKISWNEVKGAVEYQVYRATSKTGSFERVKTTSSESYTDKDTKAGKTYYYKVRGISKSGAKMPFSAVVDRGCDLAQPEIKVSNSSSSGKPKVSWGKVSGAAEYAVYRATSEKGSYEKIKETTSTSYTDKTAKAGTKYYYKVKALHSKSSYNSAYSEVVSKYCRLSRPDVTISNISSTGKIKLTWDEQSGAKEYQVYRATSENGEYKLVKTTSSTSYTHTSAKTGTKYYYKVKAIHSKSSCNSSDSEIVSKYGKLPRPEVTIKLKSGNPKLSWDEISGAVEYAVYRASSKSGEYKKVKTTTSTSFTDKDVKSGKTYYYKVKAVHSKSGGNSAYSSIKSIKAK